MRADYGRILLRFWKNSLIREMTFRGHFIVNAVGEVGWVILLLIFAELIFTQTADVKGWTKEQYIFLMGTHMIITALFEGLFFGNCWRVSELVRSGNLDFVLVRPANTQFLLSFERLDYSSLANVPVGAGLCIYSAMAQDQPIAPWQIGLFVVLIAAGVLILYSLLFMFAITSVWLIRQTGVDHLWFYAISLARYPSEIYRKFLGGTLWFALVFVVPVLMVSNLPANVVMRTFEPVMVAYILASGFALLAISSGVCRLALRWYRSASS